MRTIDRSAAMLNRQRSSDQCTRMGDCMRALLILGISALACGGRTLADSIYDGEPVDGGSGGSLNGLGGSRPAPVGGGGGRNQAGRSSGGAPGVGGSSSGGAIAKGGSFSGSGGGSLQSECKAFCTGFERVCPNSFEMPGCFPQCASSIGGSGPCEGLVRDALRCFTQATRALPSSDCATAQLALASSCLSHLETLQRCGFALSPAPVECKESASASPTACELVRYCSNDPLGTAVQCERSPDGRARCICSRSSGLRLFTEVSSAPLDRACSEVRERCWAAVGP